MEIDVKENTATVTMNVGKTLTKEVAKKAVVDSGFEFVSFKDTAVDKNKEEKKDEKASGTNYVVGVSGMK